MKTFCRLNSASGVPSVVHVIVLILVLHAHLALAAPPRALPKLAPKSFFKWQPATDYDTNGCYPTAAVGRNGGAAGGLGTTGALNGNCRDRSDLTNSNCYVRRKCSGRFCAYMYAYYFEKDQLTFLGGGHRHDFEHIVVWVQRGRAKYVSVSARGRYITRPARDVRWQGSHPKIVYHKEGAFSHVFRFADPRDEPPENHLGRWHFPALRTWGNLPRRVRRTLNTHNYGVVQIDIKDGRFNSALARAKPRGINFNPNA